MMIEKVNPKMIFKNLAAILKHVIPAKAGIQTSEWLIPAKIVRE
jgi:hypothetical protein